MQRSTVQKPRQIMMGRVGGAVLKETAQARGLPMGCSVKAVSKHAGRLDTNGQGCKTGKWFIVSYIHFPLERAQHTTQDHVPGCRRCPRTQRGTNCGQVSLIVVARKEEGGCVGRIRRAWLE